MPPGGQHPEIAPKRIKQAESIHKKNEAMWAAAVFHQPPGRRAIFPASAKILDDTRQGPAGTQDAGQVNA